MASSTLPETSVSARPAMSATASAITSCSMLSSMMMSAPASTASRTSSSVSHSTSTLRTNGMWARAAATAAVMEPAASMWLSLSITPSDRL